MHGNTLGLEDQGQPIRQALGDEVLHHLLLAIYGHPLAGDAGEVNAVVLALEAQFQPVMRQALTVQALGHARLGQGIDAALLEQASADAAFDIGAVARFEHDAIHAPGLQQPGQQQPRRPRANNANLRAHIPALPQFLL